MYCILFYFVLFCFVLFYFILFSILGVGGNLVAVQSSRISTYLNSVSKPRVLPETDPFICVSPLNVFFGKSKMFYLILQFINQNLIDLGPHSLMARLLILIAAPSHILFLFILRFFEDHFKFTFPFLALYIIAALVQISLLLYLCYCMVHLMWKFGIDPDNSSIPFLTALADLIGAFLLAGAFFILSSVNDPNASNDFTTVTLTN